MIRQLARYIRHLPGIARIEPLWDALRPIYLLAVDPFGRGVPVTVGGYSKVRMPAEFANGDWEHYEPKEVKRISDWLDLNPEGMFIDLGCSIGIYSLIARTKGVETVSIDSDRASLKATLRMCYKVGEPQVIWGFATDSNSSGFGSLEEVVAFTSNVLAGTSAELVMTRYICLEGGFEDVPRHALGNVLPRRAPALIKADIEGAELFMLRGMTEFLREVRPEVCLSVHPPALPIFGHSVEQVRLFLEEQNYSAELFHTDHEQHWWCKPNF